MKRRNEKITDKIKTRKITKPTIYVNLFKPPYVEHTTITYEQPYLEIYIPFTSKHEAKEE